MDDPENYENLIKEKIKESLRLTEIQRQQKIASGLYSFLVENPKARSEKIPFPQKGCWQKWTLYTIEKKLNPFIDKDFQLRKEVLFRGILPKRDEIKNCLDLMAELGVVVKNGPQGRGCISDLQDTIINPYIKEISMKL